MCSNYLPTLLKDGEKGDKTQDKELRIKSLTYYSLKTATHIITTAAVWWIIKDFEELDTMLGGSNSNPNYWKNYPCQTTPKYLNEFVIFKMGQCAYDTIYSFYHKWGRKDFTEFILHDIFTTGLICLGWP